MFRLLFKKKGCQMRIAFLFLRRFASPVSYRSDNVIKSSFVFSRKDAKSQSLEPISLRLCGFARAIF